MTRLLFKPPLKSHPRCWAAFRTCLQWYQLSTHQFIPTPMLVGYARVSTGEQNLDLQADALKQAGCAKIFTDQMSAAKAERPSLQVAFAFVRTGDTLIVWRLDRLGCSLKDLVQRVEDLQQRQVGFRSLHESIDTTSSVGKFQFHVFSALAEFERDLIRDRTMAGLRAARGA